MMRICLIFLMINMCYLVTFAQQAPSVDDPAEKVYQKRIKKQRLNGVYIPKDLYDTFAQLERLMDKSTLDEFKAIPEEKAGRKFYLIMWMCNNWGLYEGSRLSHYIRQLGITNPEHMAHFVITSYHRQLTGKELNIKDQVAFYQHKVEEANARKEKKQTIIHEETRQRPRN